MLSLRSCLMCCFVLAMLLQPAPAPFPPGEIHGDDGHGDDGGDGHDGHGGHGGDGGGGDGNACHASPAPDVDNL